MFHYFTSIYSICLVFFLLFYRNTKSSILLAHFTSHYYCNKNTAADIQHNNSWKPQQCTCSNGQDIKIDWCCDSFPHTNNADSIYDHRTKSSPQQKHQQICRFPYNSDHQTDHTSRCHYVKDHFILSHKKIPPYVILCYIRRDIRFLYAPKLL